MKQRLKEFDIAKAICIVLVAIGHYVHTIGVFIVVATGIVCPVLLHQYVLPRWKMTRMLFGVK